MNRRKFLGLFAAAVITIAVAPSLVVNRWNSGVAYVTRCFPELIASDLIGVHPLSGPTGIIFHMDYKYD